MILSAAAAACRANPSINLRKAAAVAVIAALSLCAAPFGWSQKEAEKPRIAVIPLKAVNVSPETARKTAVLLESALIEMKTYTVVDAKDRDSVPGNLKAAMAGCDDQKDAARIGEYLAAEQVVFGSIVSAGDALILKAKLLDVPSERILAAQTVRASNPEDLAGVCAAAARSLAAGESSTPEQVAAAGEPASAAAGDGIMDVLGIATVSGGAFLLEAGNLLGVLGFQSMLASDDAYKAYMKATDGFDALYADYSSAAALSYAYGISSYSVQGLGAAGTAAGVVFLPPASMQLSSMGRIAYAAGLTCSISGSVLAMMAGNQAYDNRTLYGAYMQATDNFDALYQAYQDGYNAYTAERIAGYSLWGAGGLAMAGAFLLPGDRTPAADGLINRILFSGGAALVYGGGWFQSMALVARRTAEADYAEYMGAAADFDALYAQYQSSHGQYVLYSALSYGFWAGGAAAVITSLFVPFGGTPAQAEAEPPAALSLVPYPGGLGIFIRIVPRRS